MGGGRLDYPAGIGPTPQEYRESRSGARPIPYRIQAAFQDWQLQQQRQRRQQQQQQQQQMQESESEGESEKESEDGSNESGSGSESEALWLARMGAICKFQAICRSWPFRVMLKHFLGNCAADQWFVPRDGLLAMAGPYYPRRRNGKPGWICATVGHGWGKVLSYYLRQRGTTEPSGANH